MPLSIFLIFLVIQNVFSQGGDLLNSLKAEVTKIAETSPPQASQYISSIQATGNVAFDSCNEGDFEGMIKKHNFDPQIVANFRQVTYSSSVEFQSFHVQITLSTGQIQEFVGCGKNQNGIIQIGWVNIQVTATLIPQYQSYRCCHRCWVVAKCCKTCKQQRPYTTQEIQIISQALRASGYQKALSVLNNPGANFIEYESIIQQQQKLNQELQQLYHEANTCALDLPNCQNAIYDSIMNCWKAHPQDCQGPSMLRHEPKFCKEDIYQCMMNNYMKTDYSCFYCFCAKMVISKGLPPNDCYPSGDLNKFISLLEDQGLIQADKQYEILSISK